METTVSCRMCSGDFTVDASQAGRKVDCPFCGKQVMVPAFKAKPDLPPLPPPANLVEPSLAPTPDVGSVMVASREPAKRQRSNRRRERNSDKPHWAVFLAGGTLAFACFSCCGGLFFLAALIPETTHRIEREVNRRIEATSEPFDVEQIYADDRKSEMASGYRVCTIGDDIYTVRRVFDSRWNEFDQTGENNIAGYHNEVYQWSEGGASITASAY